MACIRLNELPVEVLCLILVQLPTTAALSFILTCRRIIAACDNWATWRDLVAAQPTLATCYRTVTAQCKEQSIWKHYIVADALASQRQLLTRADVERWLPFMISLHRTSMRQANIKRARLLANPHDLYLQTP